MPEEEKRDNITLEDLARKLIKNVEKWTGFDIDVLGEPDLIRSLFSAAWNRGFDFANEKRGQLTCRRD